MTQVCTLVTCVDTGHAGQHTEDVVQAADDAEAGCGGELQQVEEEMAALDEELAR